MNKIFDSYNIIRAAHNKGSKNFYFAKKNVKKICRKNVKHIGTTRLPIKHNEYGYGLDGGN